MRNFKMSGAVCYIVLDIISIVRSINKTLLHVHSNHTPIGNVKLSYVSETTAVFSCLHCISVWCGLWSGGK